MPINWLTVGSLYGAAGVAFGAFGAHGLKSRGISDAKIASWGTASHYQVRRAQGERKKRGSNNFTPYPFHPSAIPSRTETIFTDRRERRTNRSIKRIIETPNP
jgi:hypothetical protein